MKSQLQIFMELYFHYDCSLTLHESNWGMWWRSWLMHCAINWKDAGSVPAGVTGIFD
jgi:hypothetical protein